MVGDEPVEGEVYAELEKRAGDTVARLAARACKEFKRWGADAGQVRLYLVPSEERARAQLRESAASDIFESGALFPGDTLERAGVKAGSCLLARVALPAAASGASCGARRLAPSLGYGASPRRSLSPCPNAGDTGAGAAGGVGGDLAAVLSGLAALQAALSRQGAACAPALLLARSLCSRPPAYLCRAALPCTPALGPRRGRRHAPVGRGAAVGAARLFQRQAPRRL